MQMKRRTREIIISLATIFTVSVALIFTQQEAQATPASRITNSASLGIVEALWKVTTTPPEGIELFNPQYNYAAITDISPPTTQCGYNITGTAPVVQIPKTPNYTALLGGITIKLKCFPSTSAVRKEGQVRSVSNNPLQPRRGETMSEQTQADEQATQSQEPHSLQSSTL